MLLFAASEAKDENLDSAVSRIQHFASLTGGHDLIIVFLLHAPPATSLISAKQLNAGDATCGIDGTRSFSSLQATLINHTEIPHIPILPLPTLDGLSALLKKHVDHSAQPPPARAASGTSFDLLQHCTANPPISQQTAYIVSDLFPNLKELAQACANVTSAPNSSSPTARGISDTPQPVRGSDNGMGMSTQSSYFAASNKLKKLRDLVGDRECNDIVDFWKEEWAIE